MNNTNTNETTTMNDNMNEILSVYRQSFADAADAAQRYYDENYSKLNSGARNVAYAQCLASVKALQGVDILLSELRDV